MRSLREVFRYNLKRLRAEAGMEQPDFAALLDIPFSTYQKLESKKSSVPQKATIQQIVAKLELVSETVLFQDPDLARPPTPEQALEVLRKAISQPK